MTLVRYDLIAKRLDDVMEPRKNGAWVDADEALRAVSDARVAGQRMGLDEVRGCIRHMRVGNRTAGLVAALDEMEIHVEAALSRLDSGERLAGTSGFGMSEPTCTCPVLDDVPVTGSSCAVHGLSAVGFE